MFVSYNKNTCEAMTAPCQNNGEILILLFYCRQLIRMATVLLVDIS